LLQESPGRDGLVVLGKKLFGADAGILPGVDASLIVQGRVIPADLAPGLRSYFVQAHVVLRSGSEVEVICTRLVPPVFRLDLWSPDCWREQQENRQQRREQLAVIVHRLESVPASVPLIVGCDFNAPQGHAVFRLLQPRLHDAFRDGGRGWGDTVTNDFPVLRIDQVWASEAFRAVHVVARGTRHSDHRMVICDLVLRARLGAAGGKH
jgi:endonuclease/exonuclease/phosphatase (EEP) superfamily protein YafD